MYVTPPFEQTLTNMAIYVRLEKDRNADKNCSYKHSPAPQFVNPNNCARHHEHRKFRYPSLDEFTKRKGLYTSNRRRARGSKEKPKPSSRSIEILFPKGSAIANFHRAERSHCERPKRKHWGAIEGVQGEHTWSEAAWEYEQ